MTTTAALLPYLDAYGTAAPGAVLGVDRAETAHWWAPATHGPLEIVGATGAGRTHLARAVVAQLVRQGAVPPAPPVDPDADDGVRFLAALQASPVVTVVGQVHEWRPLVDACDARDDLAAATVYLVPADDLEEIADALRQMADMLRMSHTAVHRDGHPAPGRYRYLVWDDAPRHLAMLHRRDADAYHATREALALLAADGPALAFHTAVTTTPTGAPVFPARRSRRAVARLTPAHADRLMPGADTPADGPARGAWHVDADGGPVLVQAPALPTDPADLARFVAGAAPAAL